MIIHNIPAGYPLVVAVKMQRSTCEHPEYEDVTDASLIIPDDGSWYINFVDDNNKAYISYNIDWSALDPVCPWIAVPLTAEQTLSVKGKVLHIEISNSVSVSGLIKPPDAYYYFVPNKIPPHTK